MTEFRRVALFLTIGSFSLAALLGVVALLGGGEFGETQARVLCTTLAVGITSIAVLCNLATGGTPYRPVGALGGLSSLATLAISLVLIWSDLGDSVDWERLWQAFGIGCVVSATLAQLSLLLVLAAGAAPAVRALLAGTLVAATWAAVHVSALIVDLDAGETSIRVLGVVAILDVLGTVATAALARFGGSRPAPAAHLEVPPDLVRLVGEQAAATGSSPEQVLREALLAGLRSGAAR